MIGVFLGLLALGLTLGAVALFRRDGGRSHQLLGERLARGDVSTDEYRERLAALGPKPRRTLATAAIAVTTVGLIGTLAVGAMAGPGFMHMMMDGGMGSMMGSGDTERSGPAPVAGARDVRVVGQEFSFSPAEIRIRAGEAVNLMFENRGHMFHTLTLSGLGVDLRANGGDRIAAAVRGEKKGSYPFVCAVSGHAAAGMRGTVIVT